MQQLLDLIAELETKIPAYQQANANVSAANIGWHIQHTTLATVRIIDAIKQSDPTLYRRKFNWKRSFLYLINRIPRGRGKAPKSVLPNGEISVELLNSGIEKAKGRVKELVALQPGHYFNHPYLGDLNLKDAIKFLQLHTRHHIKIINEIVPG